MVWVGIEGLDKATTGGGFHFEDEPQPGSSSLVRKMSCDIVNSLDLLLVDQVKSKVTSKFDVGLMWSNVES